MQTLEPSRLQLPLHVKNRQSNLFSSTYESEILTCSGVENHRILAKYEGAGGTPSYGNRGGIPYEALIYSKVLPLTSQETVGYWGHYLDRESGTTWLFTEYIEGNCRISESWDSTNAIVQAARWIGRFHSEFDDTGQRDHYGFLKKYDSAYYAGWVDRTMIFADSWHEDFPWIRELRERLAGWSRFITSLDRTIIHGEYYPKNVLIKDGTVYPVDWESAALAPGEIDIVTLTEGWPGSDASLCLEEYRNARWPEAAPGDLLKRVSAAKVYMELRWLGDSPECASDAYSHTRLHNILAEGESCGWWR